MVFAYVQHTIRLVLRDVEIQQFLTQSEPFTTTLHSFGVLIDLEQEKYIVLVDLVVILVDQLVDIFFYFSNFLCWTSLLCLGF